MDRLRPRVSNSTRDAEGFTALDTWAADSLSDRVVIFTSNGLYGATIVLNLPTISTPVTMRGRGQ